MRWCFKFVICLLMAKRSTQEEGNNILRLPENLKIGIGGASYQIEGAWNISGKGENVWDRFTHSEPWRIVDGSNGDTACDSYIKYEEDVQWVKELGLDHYRFSISWARLLPQGNADFINPDGLRYYHNLIDELLANKIEPVVTIYHWDHPQILEDMGGWMNESMVTWFSQYSDIIFQEFGPKVKIFTTINEPQLLCGRGYGDGTFAPGKMMNTSGAYLCGHNVLKAHATAYHLYDEKYRATQNGEIGIVSHCAGYIPKTPADTVAADIAFQFQCGWISHPIFVGDYPEVMKTRLAKLSKDAGLLKSQLPEFSPEWIEYIRGTCDYFGLNHYTSELVEEIPNSDGSEDIWGSGISYSSHPSWQETSLFWLKIVPDGFRIVLQKIKDEYNNPPVYVTENGAPNVAGILYDYQRIEYFHLYIKALILAVQHDGCNVQKYMMWSLLDNFEWLNGYGNGFGLINVNFTSPNRERVPKLSVSWLKKLVATRELAPLE